MNSFIALSFTITLTSCLTVSFNQPQPKDGKRLQEFPEELRGTWISADCNSFSIDATGIRTSSLTTNSLENVIDTAYHFTSLSDTMRLYQGGKYYIYNEQSSNNSWTFTVLEVDDDGTISNYLCDNFKFYSKLKGLKTDSVSYRVARYFDEMEESDEILSNDTTVYNPSVKELSKIDYGEIRWIYFNGQIRIRDLRKIAVRKNLFSIYRTDGTFEEGIRNREAEEEDVMEE